MNTSHLICLFPSDEVFANTGELFQAIGLPFGITTKTDETRMNAYTIDESRDKLIERYKISLKSMNPHVIPSQRYYQSDLASMIRSHQDPDKDHYEPLVGFYEREPIIDEREIHEGDLIMTCIEDGTLTATQYPRLIACNVNKVNKVRSGLITSRLFGRYNLTTVVGKDGTYNASKLANIKVTENGKEVGLIISWRLKKVSAPQVLENEYPKARVRAGSPVPSNHMQFA